MPYDPLIGALMVDPYSDENTTTIETDPNQTDVFSEEVVEKDVADLLEKVNDEDQLPARIPKKQTSLFGDDEWWEEMWQGMPEFVQEDLTPARTLYIHFRTDEDVREFLEVIDQTVTPKTKSIWFPKMEMATFKHLHWVSSQQETDEES